MLLFPSPFSDSKQWLKGIAYLYIFYFPFKLVEVTCPYVS